LHCWVGFCCKWGHSWMMSVNLNPRQFVYKNSNFLHKINNLSPSKVKIIVNLPQFLKLHQYFNQNHQKFHLNSILTQLNNPFLLLPFLHLSHPFILQWGHQNVIILIPIIIIINRCHIKFLSRVPIFFVFFFFFRKVFENFLFSIFIFFLYKPRIVHIDL